MATVNDIVWKLSEQVGDTHQQNWSFEEILGWVNAAVGDIVRRRPDLGLTQVSASVSPGRNTIPADGFLFLRLGLVRTPSNPGGRAVRRLDPVTLDAYDPTWQAVSGEPYGYVAYDNDPLAFYLVPSAPTGTTADVVYAKAPAPLTDGGAAIPLPDTYVGPIVDYALSQLYAKDAEYAADGGLATVHMNKYLAGVQ